MKISSAVVVASLMLVTSFVYGADLGPYLQVKKNSTKNAGITYTAILSDEEQEYTISERGANMLLESKEYTNNKYLLCDNKIYQIPELPESIKDMVLSVVVLSGDAKENFEEEIDKFKIPDYKGFAALDKETVNGYQCQVAEKVTDEKKMLDEYGNQFTVQRVLKVYIVEKYGYPTRIEKITRSKYAKETKWTSALQDEDTINFVDFDTDISKKMLSLPKNAFIVDPTNKNMFDANAMKQQYMQKLKEQYGGGEEDED